MDGVMGRVDGKIALITGGASGIGLASARLLLEQGAKVVLADRDKPAADAALAALEQRATFHLLDVTREDHWIAVTDAVVAECGRIDVLVNSAGVGLLKDIEATTLDDWRALMAVNLDGTFLGCKHAVRVMKERGGGSIINMSSVAGLIGHGNLAAYCASKGGVRLLTKSVALHCARKGYAIRCNSVHPSFVETPMLRGMIAAGRNPAKMAANYTSAAPLGRLAQPVEVARTILFLASEESSFTTGAELVVDGGLTAA
jgi:3(or 17)beta-hydroxysteroid dehydrogenase